MAERFRKRYREKTAPSYVEEDYKKKLDPARGGNKEVKKLAKLWYKEVLKPEAALGSKAVLLSNDAILYFLIGLGIVLLLSLIFASISFNDLFNEDIPGLTEGKRKTYAVVSIVIVTMCVTLIISYYFIIRWTAKWTNIILFTVSAGLFAYIHNELSNLDTYDPRPNQIPSEAQTIANITLAGAIISGIATLIFLGFAVQTTPEEDTMQLVLEKTEREREENILKRIRKHQDEAIEEQKEKWEKAKLNEQQKNAVMDQALKLYLEKIKKEKKDKDEKEKTEEKK